MIEGRSELKYLIGPAQREAALRLVAGVLRPDPSGASMAAALPGRGGPDGGPPWGYAVHSLYLDDAGLRGYAERLAGARIRNRMRIRTYGFGEGSPAVFFEAKRKRDDQVIKHRTRVGTYGAWRALAGAAPWRAAAAAAPPKAARAAARWVEVADAAGLRSVCTVHYLRETYMVGSARLTFDHEVRATPCPAPQQIVGPGTHALLPPGWIVLELKFGGAAPAWARGIVAGLRLCAEPVSKFGLGVWMAVRGEPAAEAARIVPPSVLRWQRGQGAAAR